MLNVKHYVQQNQKGPLDFIRGPFRLFLVFRADETLRYTDTDAETIRVEAADLDIIAVRIHR